MTFWHYKKFGLLALVMLFIPIGSAFASNNWAICRYEFNTLQVNHKERTIVTELTKATSLSNDCPKLGETLTFQPERLDYQGYLPFKKFPKVGQKRELIYRYLDGICKNDGNEKPCRIQHFSVK